MMGRLKNTLLAILILIAWAGIFYNANANAAVNALSEKSKTVSEWLITHLAWGSMKIGSQSFEDCRIWNNHAESWDWGKTNTHHNPGIQIEDLSDFIDTVDTIILSQGVNGVLQIKPETIEYLEKLNKTIIIERTPKAVERYNELLLKGERVGALIHTTC